MKAKFTKGKWMTETDIDHTMIVDNSRNHYFIAKVANHWINHESNALLILASPDLFNALNELLQVKEWKDKNGKDEHYSNAQPIAWENARKAINKALGK